MTNIETLLGVSITLGSVCPIVAWSSVTTLKSNGGTMSFVPVVPTGAAPVAPKPNGKAAPAGQPTYAELKAKIAELEAKALIANKPRDLEIRIKTGEQLDKQGQPVLDAEGNPLMFKGTVCVYGLGRFPVALYAESWERLLAPETVTRILTACKDPRASRKVR